MNLSKKDSALLENWLADQSFHNWVNQSNSEDVLKWENYFNGHPNDWELAKIGKLLAQGVSFKDIPKSKFGGQKALGKLLNQINRNSIEEKPKASPKVVRLHRRWWMAASIVALLMIGGLSYFQLLYNPEVLIATKYGEQVEVALPDGSKVTLNANSTLKYYDKAPRKVWLKGEAFFEVKKIEATNENFLVLTNDLTVRVLGTSFNVNSRNDKTKVFLEEGKVKLEVKDFEKKELEMIPGDQIIYSKKQNKLIENKQNASKLENASWKDGTLIFKDVPLPQALYEIEDIYGIQFILQEEALKEKMISGGVPIKNLNLTISTLREVHALQIRTEGKRYFISKKEE